MFGWVKLRLSSLRTRSSETRTTTVFLLLLDPSQSWITPSPNHPHSSAAEITDWLREEICAKVGNCQIKVRRRH